MFSRERDNELPAHRGAERSAARRALSRWRRRERGYAFGDVGIAPLGDESCLGGRLHASGSSRHGPANSTPPLPLDELRRRTAPFVAGRDAAAASARFAAATRRVAVARAGRFARLRTRWPGWALREAKGAAVGFPYSSAVLDASVDARRVAVNGLRICEDVGTGYRSVGELPVHVLRRAEVVEAVTSSGLHALQASGFGRQKDHVMELSETRGRGEGREEPWTDHAVVDDRVATSPADPPLQRLHRRGPRSGDGPPGSMGRCIPDR